MAIRPLSVATRGYLDGVDGVATRGYIYIATVGVVSPSGGSTGKTRTVKGRTVESIQQQLREDEEIITIVMAAIEQDLL